VLLNLRTLDPDLACGFVVKRSKYSILLGISLDNRWGWPGVKRPVVHRDRARIATPGLLSPACGERRPL
jgi:hypothetical protein